MFARYFKKTPKAPTIQREETTGDNEPTTAAAAAENPPDDISTCFGSDVWLKYKEGFTNAVRYNIKISKLL
jgi:hypothetical protein